MSSKNLSLLISQPTPPPSSAIATSKIEISRISLALPLGVHIDGLSIPFSQGQNREQEERLYFTKIQAGLRFWQLFTGHAGLWIDVERNNQENLKVTLKLPFTQIIRGNPIPTNITFMAHNFTITELLSFAMQMYAKSPTANPLITPLLEQLRFQGQLKGNSELSIANQSLTSLSGDISLELVNFRFESQDPNLIIPEQLFSKALLKILARSGTINILEDTYFQSEQLSLGLNGSVTLDENTPQSKLALSIPLEMRGDILEKIGVLVEMALLSQQIDWQGKVRLNIAGNMAKPQISATSL